jgi:hypothetical protein
MERQRKKSKTDEKPTENTKRRRFRIFTLKGVKREMIQVYADMRNKIIEPAIGTKLVYALMCIAKIIESEHLINGTESIRMTKEEVQLAMEEIFKN